MMSFLYSSSSESDVSSSSESPQSSPNTSENDQSPNVSRTDNFDEIGTILNFSRAFWNLPADDSTEAKNVQDAKIIDDETIFSTSDRDIDEIPESDRMLSLFRRNPVQRRIDEGHQSSDKQSEPVILKQLKVGNLVCEQLLLILVALVPASAIVVGAQFIGHCPANWFIPYLVLLIGVLSTIFMVYIIINLFRGQFGTSGEKDINGVGKSFGWLLGIFMLIEITLFFDMAASFDTSSKNYCSRSFYFYAAFFNIFIIASFIIGGLLKFSLSAGHVNLSHPFPEEELGF